MKSFHIHTFNKKVSTLLILLFVTHLSFGQAQRYREVDGTWTAFFQTIDASFLEEEVKFRVSASLKAKEKKDSAYAAIWVRVDNKENTSIFYTNSVEQTLESSDWQTYVLEGSAGENTGLIYIGGFCVGEGKFLFDNFQLEVENEDGVLVKAPLKNASFEEPMTSERFPGWNYGIKKGDREKVKGFSFSNTEDTFEGRQALQIIGANIKEGSSEYIGPLDDYTPQVGVLVSMLNNLKSRVESKVFFLSQKETDYAYDSIANSIGALIMHLAAAEAIYQVYTFDEREYFNEEEEAKWGAALRLGEEARERFNGKDISWYLEQYDLVRTRTLEELKKRDDEWLQKKKEGRSNFFMWFHVMEHQSSHLGQILMQTKRYPKEDLLEYELKEH